MSNKKRAKKKYTPKFRNCDYISVRDVGGIKVTEDPINLPGKEKFKGRDEDLYSESYDCLRSDPHKSASILESLLKKYPKHPTLITNLSAAYVLLGKKTEAYELAETNYKKNYFYPLARISYASSLINQNRYLDIPKIFDYHLMINRAFPDRQMFHSSEVVGFSHVMLQYHIHHYDYKEVCTHRLILRELDEKTNISSLQMFLVKLQSKLKANSGQTRLRY